MVMLWVLTFACFFLLLVVNPIFLLQEQGVSTDLWCLSMGLVLTRRSAAVLSSGCSGLFCEDAPNLPFFPQFLASASTDGRDRFFASNFFFKRDPLPPKDF